MPALTVETSPNPHAQESPANSSFQSTSGSTSPIRPPVSPITPPLGATQPAAPRQTYTHSQPHQTTIPQPQPVPITLDENTDAIALKAAISILQIQARNAENDIKSLQRTKERALQNPGAFMKAAADGRVSMAGDNLFSPKADNSETLDGEEEDEDKGEGASEPSSQTTQDPATRMARKSKDTETEKWEKLPKPQNVVRAPPINWQKYAVVGESLDKLHEDQLKRPTEGRPQILGPDGKLQYGGDAPRRQTPGVAAPYTPGKDKIAKAGKKKGGKR
ncbi:hypothetical protein B0O99DRAFT_597589 [Bisporella sp. PMI_857]|nr:hypothetical protein B0O99DRAFT_597589 [Bisporella sp. PMI_857]